MSETAQIDQLKDPSPISSSSGEAAPSGEGAEAKISARPDPEVPVKKKRRYLSVQYKLRILAEADTCTEQGQIGALLRREGLYSSNLSHWRKQREQGVLQQASRKRGPKSRKNDGEQKRIQELERENAKLREDLKKAETVIEFQKKVSDILGIPGNQDDTSDNGS